MRARLSRSLAGEKFRSLYKTIEFFDYIHLMLVPRQNIRIRYGSSFEHSPIIIVEADLKLTLTIGNFHKDPTGIGKRNFPNGLATPASADIGKS